MKKILGFANGEKCQLIAGLVCLVLLVWGIGCESKVSSLLNPERRVTRMELQAEVDLFLARAGNRFKTLDQLDAFKVMVFKQAEMWSVTGTFNPSAVIPLIVSILGIGAIADNVAKRRKIKKLNGPQE